MKLSMVIFCTAILTGCATAYKPDGISGGFAETQLDKNLWRVSFHGNGYTRSERAEEMAMLRSAELTLLQGYKYFGFVNSRTSTSTHAISQPSTSYTTGSVSSFGNTAYGSATTRTYGGSVIFVNTPSSTNTVMMFQDRPNTDGMIYDAQFVCNSLGSKYEVKCGEKR